jgi:hypothetical protein
MLKLAAISLALGFLAPQEEEERKEYKLIFNGKDFTGWKADDEAKKHWTIADGILRYDGKGGPLWTEAEYENCVFEAMWRLPSKPVMRQMQMILPDGRDEVDDDGKPVTRAVADAGAGGMLFRGHEKAMVHLWCSPVGSGDIPGYRTDPASTPEVRMGCRPSKKTDKAPGEWNIMNITIHGDRVTMSVDSLFIIKNAQLPGLKRKGPLGLAGLKDPIEFQNIYAKVNRSGP